MDWEHYIVKINVKVTEIDLNKPLDKTNILSASGTGFFICKNLILTCYHVVKYAVHIEIIYNQTNILKGQLVYIFPDDDLAIIKINENFDSIKIFDYKEIQTKLRLNVLSIGFPLNNTNIIETKGIISGYRKSLLQTDATLNPGNSGGPSIIYDNKKWKVIGINVAKLKFDDVENTSLVIPYYRFNKYKKLIQINKSLINLIISNSIPSIFHSPTWNFNYQLIKQEKLRSVLFQSIQNVKNSNIFIKNKIGIRISQLNSKNYLNRFFNINDILLFINNNKIDINGFIKFDFFPEKIAVCDLYLWFVPGDELNIVYIDSTNNQLKTTKVKLEYQMSNLIEIYNLVDFSTDKLHQYSKGIMPYFIENNDLILCIFTQEHYQNISNLNITSLQVFKLLDRYLYNNDLFTVYLTSVNPNIYLRITNPIIPIGDIIIEINGKSFNDYFSFIECIKEPIKMIKTIDNNIFFVD